MRASIIGALIVVIVTFIGSYTVIKVNNAENKQQIFNVDKKLDKHEEDSKKNEESYKCELKEMQREIQKNHHEILGILREQSDKIHGIEVHVARIDERVQRITKQSDFAIYTRTGKFNTQDTEIFNATE